MSNVPSIDFGLPADLPEPAGRAASASRPGGDRPSGDGLTAGSPHSDQLIAALRAEVLAHHRLALLGNVSAMFAHEINNLLTPVLAYSQEALRDSDTAFMRKALERAARQTERVVTIGRKLLELAHGVSPDSTPRPLQRVLDDALLALARPFEKDRIELEIDVEPELRIDADGTLLEQLLLNLLLYVRDACNGHSGRVVLRGISTDEGPRIEISACCARLPGPAQVRSLAEFFAIDPRETIDDWRPIGMGLSICRLIARLHDAAIEVRQSEPGTLDLRVCWPAANGAAPPSA